MSESRQESSKLLDGDDRWGWGQADRTRWAGGITQREGGTAKAKARPLRARSKAGLVLGQAGQA